MSDRIAVLTMAVVTALALVLAPWGAVNRETGARSAVVLLPERYVDFTGRTAPVGFPAGTAVLLMTAAGVLLAAGGALTGSRARHGVWLAAAVLLVGANTWGVSRFGAAVDDARLAAVRAEVEAAIADPNPRQDPEVLREALAAFDERSLAENVVAVRAGGLNIRRLPYANVGPAWAAFLAVVLGIVSALAGLRAWAGPRRAIDAFLRGAAVPAISILLALAAAAVVILLLQPTPSAPGVELGAFERLVGRLDTLWYAYYTMFRDALGTVGGFAESLKLATPLIFTGLAVAFGFQAGLFNIGAPGQMVLGAIAAAMVGIYMPGPRVVTLPLAVLGAFLGGALWGALPGWLKARFGANEVIATILLNFVAASVLLFILSSSNVFAAPALRILAVIGVAVLVALVLALVPPVRRAARRAPRLAAAALAVGVLVACVVAGQPRPGDRPVTVQMPFKVPGNEPKSQPLRVEARLPQLPAMVGIDTRTSPGVNVVRVDYARLVAPLLALASLFYLGRFKALRAWPARLGAAAGVGVAAYLLGMLLGLDRLATAVPPTNLNASFFIALLAAALVYVLLFKTRFGYELRAVGLAPGAAEYGGANIPRTTVVTMAISGGLAGLTATHYVLGGALEDFALRQSIPTSDGFDGIAVALLAGNHPFGILLSAFLFGVMKYGGSVLNITFPNLTREVVSMILALVVLFIAARGFLPQSFVNPAFRRRFTHAGQRDTVEGEEPQPLAQAAKAEEGA
ncbi:MAG TPA: ABC transporter permease [Trueperaceae bacterium]|nr:ABC transporter permease [Trueperaceae bacterium]